MFRNRVKKIKGPSMQVFQTDTLHILFEGKAPTIMFPVKTSDGGYYFDDEWVQQSFKSTDKAMIEIKTNDYAFVKNRVSSHPYNDDYDNINAKVTIVDFDSKALSLKGKFAIYVRGVDGYFAREYTVRIQVKD